MLVDSALVDGHVVDDLVHLEQRHVLIAVLIEGVAIGIIGVLAEGLVVGDGTRGLINLIVHEVDAEVVVALGIELYRSGRRRLHRGRLIAVSIQLQFRDVLEVLATDFRAGELQVVALGEVDRHLVQIRKGLQLDFQVVGVEAVAINGLNNLQVSASVVGHTAHRVVVLIAILVLVMVAAAIITMIAANGPDGASGVRVLVGRGDPARGRAVNMAEYLRPVAAAVRGTLLVPDIRVALLHIAGGLRLDVGSYRVESTRRRRYLAEVHKERSLALIAN